jgi:hypothetical protein
VLLGFVLGPLKEAGLLHGEAATVTGQTVGDVAARRWGVAPGDRVASWLPKTRMTSLLPLACARAAGAQVVAVATVVSTWGSSPRPAGGCPRSGCRRYARRQTRDSRS